MLIGLTGGIASGKTLASDYLSTQGVVTVDTDVVARDVVKPGTEGLARIVDQFGPQVLSQSGELDRKKLKSIVFNDAPQLKRLNQILHPLIRQQVRQTIRLIDADCVVVVIPLLTQQVVIEYDISRVLLIDVHEQVQLERVKNRDQVSEQLALKIMASQPPRAERLNLADDIVVNDSSVSSLYEKLDLLLPVYRQWGLGCDG